MISAITNEQVAQFQADGYLDIPKILNEAEVDQLRERTKQIAEGRINDFPAASIEYEPGKEGLRELSAVRKLNRCASNDALFQEFASHQHILDVIESLLGPDITLFDSQVFMKPPGGIEKPYHQDSAYFSIMPMSLITCWIALDEVTLKNGCLWVIPGSHLLGLLPHSEPWMVGDRQDMQVPQSAFDASRATPILMSPGDCSLHHSLILHRSLPNETQTSRRGVAFHYMSSTSRWTNPEKPQPEYQLLRGRTHPGCV